MKKKSTNKNLENNKKKTKTGFTLIELLAVIIILGILVLIAIPSVTKVINDSRKETYIDTVKKYVNGATILVNSGGDISFYDQNTTMYIPTYCIPTENGNKSPFGEFDPGYVVVIFTGSGYKYYWTGRDTASMGIYLSNADKLNEKLILTGVEVIDNTIGIGDRDNILVINDTCRTSGIETISATITVPEDIVAYSLDDIRPGISATLSMDNDWFTNSGITKAEVKSINVTNHQNIPSGAVSWDAGNGVKAWRVQDGNLYNVYIGAEKGVLAPVSSNKLFYKFENVTSMDLRYLNTSNVTDMSLMFQECSSLTSLDLRNFNTSRVTKFTQMFYEMNNLETLKITSFNTSAATHMGYMFRSSKSIKVLDLSSFSNFRNYYYMFANCSSLETIYVKNGSITMDSSGSNAFLGATKLVGGSGTRYSAEHVGGDYAHVDGGPSNPGYFSVK